MLADLNAAETSITITALSINAPLPSTVGALGAFWVAIELAARRGIAVQLITAAPCLTHPATRYNGNAARFAHSRAIGAHLIHLPRLLHAKTALIDQSISWIGSGNFTQAAMTRNHEAYIRCTDPSTAKALAAFHLGLTHLPRKETP